MSSSDWQDNLDVATQRKLDAARDIVRSLGRVVVAFSAGVDSTFLLALAVEALAGDGDNENVIAAIGISPSLADRERQAGRRLAQTIGAELVEIDTGELDDPNYSANPAERCFYCKSDLFQRLNALARQRSFNAVLSGANADDTGDFRPGLRAGSELGVRSPLMETGLTKDEIRAASRAMGLETWNKPAMACLASRIPYGQEITSDKLGRVERAEYVLKDLGFSQCRVRDGQATCRIEVPSKDIPRLTELRGPVVRALTKLGYTYVTLDLQGFRSGSMNETLDSRTKQLKG